MSGRAGYASGEVRRAHRTLATLRSHAINDVGDEDGVDLGNVARVVPLMTVRPVSYVVI